MIIFETNTFLPYEKPSAGHPQMGQPGGPEFHGHPGHPAPPQGHPQGAPPPGHPQQPHQPMSNWFEPMWNFRVETKFWLEIFTPSFNFFPFFSLLINCTLRNVTYVEKLPFEYTKKNMIFLLKFSRYLFPVQYKKSSSWNYQKVESKLKFLKLNP